mmetsp:Transcript_13207/g.13374  ORF Transcript_13207/g.13374 Transcript_13207/m.13374 type:complete len:81 (-) Transcript_13207:125-367(-)
MHSIGRKVEVSDNSVKTGVGNDDTGEIDDADIIVLSSKSLLDIDGIGTQSGIIWIFVGNSFPFDGIAFFLFSSVSSVSIG